MAQRRALPHSLHSLMITVCLDGNSVCSTISLSLMLMLGQKHHKTTLHCTGHTLKRTPTVTTVCLQQFLQVVLLHRAVTGNQGATLAAISQEPRKKNCETQNFFWKDFEKRDGFSSFSVFSSSLDIHNIHSDQLCFLLVPWSHC